MPKGHTIKRLDRPEDIVGLEQMFTDVWELLEGKYKQFLPAAAPKEPKEVTLYFDEDAQKFKFVKADGTTETIQSS